MSNYNNLKSSINNNIYENQTQQITGTVLNAILNEMTNALGAGYQFAGVATVGMTPSEPDARIFYLAGEGIYTSFDGIQVPAGKLGILKWDNRWHLETIDGLGSGGANLTGYVSVASTDDLPDEGQPTLGYLCGTNLYLYVGEGGDTKGGKYQDCGSFRGPEGAYIQDIEQTETSHENGGRNTIKMTLSDGRSFNAYVHNGTTSSGLFPTVEALQAAYPTPVVGQYAFVGAGFPADIYVCTTAGTWTDSGEDYDGDNVDLTNYATKDEVSQLQQEVTADISQLEAKADAFVTGSQVPSVNLFDKTAVSSGKNIKRTTGGEQTNASYDATDFIPIDSRGLYCDKAYGAGAYVGAAVYNSSKQYIRGTTSKGITYEEGDAYVRFTIKVDDVNTAMCVAGTSADLPGEYVPFGPIGSYRLKDDVVETDTIKDEAVTFDKIGFRGLEIGKNKLNPAEVVSDVYINRNNGNEVDYAGAENPTSATGFIPVSKKGLHFNVGITFGTYCGAAVYNASKQYIRSCGIADYYYEEGDAFVRWSFRTSNLATAQVEEGNTGTEYEAYTEREVIDPAYLPSVESEEEEIALKVFLPDTIYAVVGDTLQIFYQSLVRSVDVSNYDVRVSCSKGRQFHRYFEYTPEAGDIGTTTFRITVLDDFGTIIGSASCNLVTVAVGASPSAGKKIVCVGASTTANGKWPAETFRRLTGSGGTPSGDGKSNIVFCGNKTKDGAGFVGNSGWGWVDYATSGRPAFRFTIGTGPNVAVGNVYTNNGYSYTIIEISDDGTILCSTSSASNVPQASGTLVKTSGSGDANVAFSASALDSQNPFWDYQNNKLTFVPFANSYCGGTIDAMYVWLGGNGLTNWKTDFSGYRGYMVDFADTLHSEFPSAKIYLVCGSMPSMKVMMPGYGASGTGWADTFGMIDSFFNLRKFYQEFANDADYSGFVEFVDATSEFDGDYNFPLTQKAVNTRNNSVTEPYANNTIHPGDAGYMQIADSVYRHFVAKFCQS